MKIVSKSDFFAGALLAAIAKTFNLATAQVHTEVPNT